MTLLWLAIALVLLLVLVTVYLTITGQRRLGAAHSEMQRQLVKLQEELSLVNNAAVGVGKHLISVEKKLALSLEKQQQLEMNAASYLPYQQAVDLVEKGASASQLVADCGIPEAEATLMALLKGNPSND
ncbi:MAG: hypothetical protein ACI9WS_001770 [Paraglaciecola psychrophila]